jgi:PEP-CTERM motif
MKQLITACAVIGLTIFAASAAYALPSDNFNDNSMDTSMWNLYQENPGNVWLEETNQRLEIRSTGNAGDGTATYVANGWGFATAEDFSFKVDFHVSSFSGSRGYEWDAILGLVKFGDIETMSNNGSSIGAELGVDEHGNENPFFWGDKTTDGIHVNILQKPRYSADGTFYISYNAAADELYLSDIGYGTTDAWIRIQGLLKGEWGGGVVSPCLTGEANVPLASGDAYLDNFVVDSGTIVLVPEPATMCLLGLGALGLLKNRRFR